MLTYDIDTRYSHERYFDARRYARQQGDRKGDREVIKTTVLTCSSGEVADATRRLCDVKTTLRSARQGHVDLWISAGSDNLHEAVVACVAALEM